MGERRLCPLAVVVGVGQDECAEVHCAWWHGGMCDVSRIAAQLCLTPGRVSDDQMAKAWSLFGGDA